MAQLCQLGQNRVSFLITLCRSEARQSFWERTGHAALMPNQQITTPILRADETPVFESAGGATSSLQE
jgi:hypothetical protein